jgi:hypothetical protein
MRKTFRGTYWRGMRRDAAELGTAPQKLSGLNTEHLLELSGLYQVPMHSREAAMKDWPLRQAPCLTQHFFAIRDPPRPAKSAAEQSRRR